MLMAGKMSFHRDFFRGGKGTLMGTPNRELNRNIRIQVRMFRLSSWTTLERLSVYLGSIAAVLGAYPP